MVGRDDDLPFRVELWDDNDSHIEQVISAGVRLCDGEECLRASDQKEARTNVTLRQKTRVLADSRRKR